MFLFRSAGSDAPPSAVTAGVDTVKAAIKKASEATGAGFAYLLRTAEKESSLKPDAQAGSSSAKGLYQFIDQTWLSVMKDEGPRFGLSNYSDAITRGSDGRLSVSDPSMRDSILNLRNDPHVAALMAGAFTNRNASDLKSSIGRDPTEGELYMAHFLGASGASRLIGLARSAPSVSAAAAFPDAADANKRIFYDKSGQPRSAGEVYQILSQGQDQIAVTPVQASSGSGPANAFAAQTEAQAYSAVPQARPAADRPFHSLFMEPAAQGGVSPFVKATWGGLAASSAPTGSPVSQAVAVAQADPARTAQGGPFVGLSTPGWVQPVRGISGVGAPLNLSDFAQLRR